VDTKTVRTADGERQYHFAVIGNPCGHSEAFTQQYTDVFSGATVTLAQVAPDASCVGGVLERSMLSDHGHVIIGMFYELGLPGHSSEDVEFTPAEEVAGHCLQRAQAGHDSGMGEIFRRVAQLSPIPLFLGNREGTSMNATPANRTAAQATAFPQSPLPVGPSDTPSATSRAAIRSFLGIPTLLFSGSLCLWFQVGRRP